MRKILYGNKVYFKLIEFEDLNKRVEWINDPDVQASLHYDYPTSLARTKKWLDKVALDNTRVELSIFSVESQECIGFCGLININRAAGKAELHIFIGNKNLWGGGYGTEAYKLLANYGFIELGLNRIYLYQNTDNDAALHIVQKIGWVKEGTLRKDLFAHGKIYDRHVVSILRDEWQSEPAYDF